jgi:hypothetical protein
MTLIFLSRDSQYFFDILTDNFFFLSQCFCSWFFLLLNKGPCIQHLSLSLSVCLFVCLFVWLYVCLVVCLFVCLFASSLSILSFKSFRGIVVNREAPLTIRVIIDR